MVGVQALAARVVGGSMIALGLVRVAEWLAPGMMKKNKAESAQQGGSWIAGWVARRRTWISGLPMVPRGIAAGALTTLLPCGWLYLFVLVAAGTGHPALAMTVMFAFWLGTLPALTALVAGTFRLAPRFGRILPLLGAVLLLTTGLYTATGRAAADLSPLTRRAAAVNDYFASRDADGDRSSVARELLDTLSGEPLPCCADGD